MGKIADFFREQHITLAGQQKARMLSLDRQFEEMEAERERLKSENLHLKAQVKPLEREVERLKDQVNQSTTQVAHERLDEISEKMLSLIANETHAIKELVIQNLRLSGAKGSYHFDLLLERGFVSVTGSLAQGMICMAMQTGRKYLTENDLL